MTPAEQEEIKKACDAAYKKIGMNAYFGNGFEAGYTFGYNRAKQENEQVANSLHATIKYNWDKHCKIVEDYEAKIKELEADNERLKYWQQEKDIEANAEQVLLQNNTKYTLPNDCPDGSHVKFCVRNKGCLTCFFLINQ
jgi:hypothetical protein